ncbi:hypothetical protein BA6E_103172 [Bacteroidales bacterium 6E]|nr:hypothetical protein BA6E_103172 [Bacteroidales bacterium 6E]
MALKFFHLPRAKRFNVPYRFYDPDKEEREERERQIREEMGIFDTPDPNKPFKPNLKGQFRQSMGRASKSAEDTRRSSQWRLIILIITLSLVFYFFFYR